MTSTADERAFWRGVWLMAFSASIVLPLFLVAAGLAIWTHSEATRAGSFFGFSFDRHFILADIASIAGLFALVGPFTVLVAHFSLTRNGKARRAILAGDDLIAPPAQYQPAPLPLPADAAEYPAFSIGDTRPWLLVRFLFVAAPALLIFMLSRPMPYIPPLGNDSVGTIAGAGVAATPLLYLIGGCLLGLGFWTLWPALRPRAGVRLFADDIGLHGVLDRRGKRTVMIAWSDARAFWTVHESIDSLKPSPSGWSRYALDAGTRLITWHFSPEYSSPQHIVGHTRLCGLIAGRIGLILRDLTPGTLGRRIHDGPITPLLTREIPRAVRWALLVYLLIVLAASLLFIIQMF